MTVGIEMESTGEEVMMMKETVGGIVTTSTDGKVMASVECKLVVNGEDNAMVRNYY